MPSEMKLPGLPAEQEQLLRSTVFTDTQPGTIVRDFQTLLDLLGDTGVEAAGQHHLFPIRLLADLNARLSNPIQVRLTRPQLRSYPNLQGLWLLLRATGLGVVRGSGSKTRVVRNEAVYASWQQLNPTERYFALLEAWLLQGQPEMIGETGGGWFGDMLMAVLQNWRSLPKKGSKIDIRPNQKSLVMYHAYHTALMQLFGFVEIKSVEPAPGGPWTPTFIRPLPLGEAMLGLLMQANLRSVGFDLGIGDEDEADEGDEEDIPFGPSAEEDEAPAAEGNGQPRQEAEPGDEEEDQDEEDEGPPLTEAELEQINRDAAGVSPFGAWLPVLQPYFPDLRHTLAAPPPVARSGRFIFKVSVEPKVWRRIAISSESTVDDLAGAILSAFRFDHEHLYEFSYPGVSGQTVRISHPYCDEGLPAHVVQIGRLPLNDGDSMLFWYDFGDDWKFDVKLEQVAPADAKQKKPKVIESAGKAPRQYNYGWE